MGDSLQQREYYKIFSGHNQTDGYDKIHLGYEAGTSETVFAKDQQTYFHYPSFSSKLLISDSNLINSGATSGPIPAGADRVYKFEGGYGKSSPYGYTSDPVSGTWLCTWLYSNNGSTPIWMDRYYDQGQVSSDAALFGGINYGGFFIDIPSRLSFEPGVLYSYFHIGEAFISSFIDTFAGDNLNRLKLNIKNWSEYPKDISIFNNTVSITPFTDVLISNGNLDFDNNEYAEIMVNISKSLSGFDEFTLGCDIMHNDYLESSYSQILGNYRPKGGAGIFYDNLHSYPFFIIPETNYGHLFYFNQNNQVYLDQSTQTSGQLNSTPSFVAIRDMYSVYIADSAYQRLIKYDHLGGILYTYSVGTSSIRSLTLSADNIILYTDTIQYIFDANLVVISSTPTITNDNTIMAIDYNGTLQVTTSATSVHYDSYNQKWWVDINNNLMVSNATSVTEIFTGTANVVHVDPQGTIWVLHDINQISKIDPLSYNIISTFTIEGVQDGFNNLSYICKYDRSINTHIWYAILCNSASKKMYVVDLNGNVVSTTSLPSNLNNAEYYTQNKDNLIFNCNGDFTGYEWKRIFGKVLYNNEPQIQFKISLSEFSDKLKPKFNAKKRTFTISAPASILADRTWHQISGTYKNHTMRLYIDGSLVSFASTSVNYNVDNGSQTNYFIGTPNGNITNFNTEIGVADIIFNGYVDGIHLYDYELPNYFYTFLFREKEIAQDLVWDIPTANIQYIEKIERFFKHKLPGSKSAFYNINITGNITDPGVREAISSDIINTI